MLYIDYPKDYLDIFNANPRLNYIPEFKALTKKKMAAVVLFADFFSPFKYLKWNDHNMEIPEWENIMREAIAKYVGMFNKATNQKTSQGYKFVRGELEDVEYAIKLFRKIQGADELEIAEGFRKNTEILLKATFVGLELADMGVNKQKQYVNAMDALRYWKEEEKKLIAEAKARAIDTEGKKLKTVAENIEDDGEPKSTFSIDD